MYKFLPALLLFSSSVFSQNYIVDESFYQGDGLTILTEVTSILELPDNKLFVSSKGYTSYNNMGPLKFFVVDENGNYSSTFSCNTCLYPGEVRHSLLAEDKIIIVGNFSSYDGVERKIIAKLNLDGSLDTSFYADVFSPESLGYNVSKIALYETNTPIYYPKIYISGWFVGDNFQPLANPLLRLNFNGSLDTSFNLDASLADSVVRSFTLLDDGKILLYSNTAGLVRINNDGSIDETFVSDVSPYLGVRSMEVLEDGKILLAGEFYFGQQKYILLRFNADGTLDESFPLWDYSSSETSSYASTLLKHVNGIYLSGHFNSFYDSSLDDFVLLNSDGTLNTNFNMGGVSNNFGYDDSYVSAILPLSSGKIIIGGKFSYVNDDVNKSLARIQPENMSVNEFYNKSNLSVYTQHETTYFNSINNIISKIEFYDISGRLIDSAIVNSDVYSCTLPNNSLILYRIFLNDGAILTGKVIR